MADKAQLVRTDGGAAKLRLVDNGDGTYSMGVALLGAAGAVTIDVASGDLAVLGATGDAPAADDTGAATAIALLKRISAAAHRASVSSVTFARPADAAPYAPGDVVGGALHLAGVGVAGGHARIVEVALRVDVAAVPVGMAGFRLHLYGVTPPSALADNAPWTLPAGDRASYRGYVDVPMPDDVGATLWSQDEVRKLVALTETGVYGYLVTAGAYVPGVSDSMTLRLGCEGV